MAVTFLLVHMWSSYKNWISLVYVIKSGIIHMYIVDLFDIVNNDDILTCVHDCYIYLAKLFMPQHERSGHLVIGSSMHLFVCLPVWVLLILSHLHKVQYLIFGWWYRYLNLDCKFIGGLLTLDQHHTPLEIGQGQNVGHKRFCHLLTLFS